MVVASAVPSAPASGRGLRAERTERRRELLDAADLVVQRDGPEVSMSAIAAAAGITKPVLYRYFGDKGGLYRALAERHTETLLADLRAALALPGPRRTRTRATVDAYLSSLEAVPQVYRFLLGRASAEDPGVQSQVEVFLRRVGDELAASLAAAAGLDPGSPRAGAWGRGIVGLVQAAGEWWLEHPDVPRAQLVADLTDLLEHGLGGATAG